MMLRACPPPLLLLLLALRAGEAAGQTYTECVSQNCGATPAWPSYFHSDPDRVIDLFIDTSALMKQAGELGHPSREDTKLVLNVVWSSAERTKVAAAVLKGLTSLLHDDTAMLNIGLEGKPTEEDKQYIVGALKRFNGDREQGMGFMKKVADIMHQGDELGHPTRATVIEALEANKLDQRIATRKLREAYRDVKDAQLKDAYRKNLEQDRQMREDKKLRNEAAAS